MLVVTNIRIAAPVVIFGKGRNRGTVAVACRFRGGNTAKRTVQIQAAQLALTVCHYVQACPFRCRLIRPLLHCVGGKTKVGRLVAVCSCLKAACIGRHVHQTNRFGTIRQLNQVGILIPRTISGFCICIATLRKHCRKVHFEKDVVVSVVAYVQICTRLHSVDVGTIFRLITYHGCHNRIALQRRVNMIKR